METSPLFGLGHRTSLASSRSIVEVALAGGVRSLPSDETAMSPGTINVYYKAVSRMGGAILFSISTIKVLTFSIKSPSFPLGGALIYGSWNYLFSKMWSPDVRLFPIKFAGGEVPLEFGAGGHPLPSLPKLEGEVHLRVWGRGRHKR